MTQQLHAEIVQTRPIIVPDLVFSCTAGMMFSYMLSLPMSMRHACQNCTVLLCSNVLVREKGGKGSSRNESQGNYFEEHLLGSWLLFVFAMGDNDVPFTHILMNNSIVSLLELYCSAVFFASSAIKKRHWGSSTMIPRTASWTTLRLSMNVNILPKSLSPGWIFTVVCRPRTSSPIIWWSARESVLWFSSIRWLRCP